MFEKPKKEAPKIIELQAKLTLLETMDEKHAEEFSEFETADQIMDRLALTYADKSASNVYRLVKGFYRYKLLAGDSMSTHINKMERMRRELANLSQVTSDEVYMVLLIESLPAEYDSIAEHWESAHPDVKTIANLNARILKKEEDLEQKAGGDQAFIANREEKPKMSLQERKRTTRCNKCGLLGHWARKCRKKSEIYSDKADDQSKPTNSKILFNVSDIDHLKSTWLADSGASAHMCNNKIGFKDLIEFSSTQECSVGNGAKVKIWGKGTVEVICKTSGNRLAAELTEVLGVV